jgi:TonB-linked SusC/RagA family outer membrane protein
MFQVPRRTCALALFALPLVPATLSAHAVGSSSVARSATTSPALVPAGTVRGRVVDKESGQPVTAAQVTVVGTSLGALTNNDGQFTINGVTAGQVTVRAARIGYQPQNQVVVVSDNGQATANFTLDRAVARLEEVVTTATGEQSRREMGNVVATVKADSIVKTQPITNVTQLLQARTAGVQVIQGQGVTGSASGIRIRGTSSLSLSNEPLIVVDGIRYDNGTEPGNTSAGVRINRFQINPDDIESLDIIKGPSASALYGTAAANGVIVIKTKRGTASAPRWSGFGEGGLTSMPTGKYPANYWSFGHNLTNGLPTGNTIHCTVSNAALGRCKIDSTTSYNPWTNPLSQPYANGPRGEGGIQVSGGNDVVKYFMSVDREDETGPYKMPQPEIDRITALRSGVTPRQDQIRPNRLKNTSLRGSFTFPIGRNANLDISTSYADRDLTTPFDGTFFAGLSNQLYSAPGFKTVTNGTAREFVGDIYSVNQRLTLERFTGSGAFNWSPITWLQLTAEGGVDNGNANNYQIQLPGEGTVNGSAWGPTASQGFSGKDIFRTNNLQYTATVRGAANRRILSNVNSQTTVGFQWFKTGSYQLFGEGYGLALGASTPNAAQQRLASETTNENKTYGAFASEQLSWNDRLFLTVSARDDQNSAFGRNVGTTIYPSANASYVISEEPWFPRMPVLDKLRLRTSVGQAGLQPSSTAALQFLVAQTYPIGGQEVPGEYIRSLGNSKLKPEITTEFEGGFDAGLLDDRLNLEFTLFNKISRGQLFQRPLPPSYGIDLGTQWVNIAKVQNRGIELAADAQILTLKQLSWNIHANGSHIKNKLVDIGDVVLAQGQGVRQVVGYPLNGLWDRPYTYNDANGDGVIVPSEITLAAQDAYRGSTLPEYEAGLSNTFGFFNGALTFNSLLDYRGKFWNSYTIGSNRAVSAGNAPEVNVPGWGLADQAAAVAAGSAALRNTRWGIFKPNDFIRLRELSLSYRIPDRFVQRYARAKGAQLVFSGRNLGVLWTKYPGVDPEANRSITSTGGGNDDLGTAPVIRYWITRVNLNF